MQTTIAAGVPVNTVSSAAIVPQPSSNQVIPPQVQTVSTQQNDPRLASGARLQEANFAERQRAAEQPSEAPPAAAPEKPQEKSGDPAAAAGSQEKGEGATGAKPAGDKSAKEEDDASKYLVQPSQPAPPARVAAPELPDYIRERLEKVKAEETKRGKEKPAPVVEFPVENRDKGPQQPVARAVVKPAVRTSPIPVAFTLKAGSEKPRVGDIVSVAVIAKGQAAIEGGKLSVKFNPAKMKVSGVLYGAGDANVQVANEVVGDELRVNFAAPETKSVTEGATLLIIQFVMLEPGDVDIELKADQAHLSLSGNGSARVTSQPVKIRIVK